jgi:hypothetical protein
VRYWITATLGLVLFVGGIAAFEYGLYQLMQVGTCSSGGPYVSARECPSGTAGYAAMLPGGIIGALIGAGLFMARGKRSGGREHLIGSGAVTLAGWVALFAGSGAVALYSSLGGDPGPGAKGTGIFLGALFIPMGLVPVILAIKGRGYKRRFMARQAVPRPVVPQPMMARRDAVPARPAPQGDALDRLRELGELRDKGVLTPAEFDAAKARILAEL